MGGYGSGRHWHHSPNRTTADYYRIDIRRWCQWGRLAPGTIFTPTWTRDGETIGSIRVVVKTQCVILSYRNGRDGESQDMSYPVDLEWTECNLGGKRPWFRCPARNCGRRVAILYGGKIFACRKCYHLVYPSQRDDIGDRAARRADKIRERLGWEPGILNGEGYKPKGMHWKTFERLCLLHEDLVILSLRSAAIRFGIDVFNF